MNEERKHGDRAILTQKQGAEFLGVSRRRFVALEASGYFKRLNDANGGVSYRRVDLEKLWTGEEGK